MTTTLCRFLLRGQGENVVGGRYASVPVAPDFVHFRLLCHTPRCQPCAAWGAQLSQVHAFFTYSSRNTSGAEMITMD